MEMKRINWPTDRHQALAEHILGVCNGNCIGVRLKGSIAKGTSTRYSDIDITINGRITRDIVEAMVFGFETPLMINASENPPGLLIVAYRSGLALDLGIGDTDDSEATIGSIVLAEGLWHSQGSLPDELQEYLKTIAMTDDGSKIKKLIHKGLLKYLSGKREEAKKFIDEIEAVAGLKRRRPPAMSDDFQSLVDTLVDAGDAMRAEFTWLLQEAREQPEAKR
jgi:hypothetical protein